MVRYAFRSCRKCAGRRTHPMCTIADGNRCSACLDESNGPSITDQSDALASAAFAHHDERRPVAGRLPFRNQVEHGLTEGLRAADARRRADSTTQSALSFKVAISEAVSNPSSISVGTAGGVKTSAGSASPDRSPATSRWVADQPFTSRACGGWVRQKSPILLPDTAAGRYSARCCPRAEELKGRRHRA